MCNGCWRAWVLILIMILDTESLAKIAECGHKKCSSDVLEISLDGETVERYQNSICGTEMAMR